MVQSTLSDTSDYVLTQDETDMICDHLCLMHRMLALTYIAKREFEKQDNTARQQEFSAGLVQVGPAPERRWEVRLFYDQKPRHTVMIRVVSPPSTPATTPATTTTTTTIA